MKKKHDKPWEAKFFRAHELLKQLDVMIVDFTNRDSVRIDLERVAENSYRCRLINLEQPGVVFSLLSGEILHNLRSALDSSLYDLIYLKAAKRKRKVRLNSVAFPIKNNPESFYEVSRSSWHQSVLTWNEMEAIESMQFYFHINEFYDAKTIKSYKKTFPLNRLRDMSNFDKHRNLRAVLCELHTFPIAMPSGEIENSHFVAKWPWKSGDIIYEFQTVGMDPNDVPAIMPRFNIALAEDIRPLQVESINNVLGAIASQVGRTLAILDELRIAN